jgi:hypothetical protein
MTPGDRPVSPRQAAQLRADIMFVRDPDVFDAFWPPAPRLDMACSAALLAEPQTDSPHPFRFRYSIAVAWPLEQVRN